MKTFDLERVDWNALETHTVGETINDDSNGNIDIDDGDSWE